MALGASGVWMGTRFVATLESSAHPVYKHAVLEAVETDTIYTTVFDGGWPDAPHRVLRNSTIARIVSGAGGSADRPGAGDVIAYFADGTPVIRYAADEPLADMDGEVEAMALYAGQSAAVVRDIPPASTLVPSLMNRSREALSNALSRLQEDSAPALAHCRGGPVGMAAPIASWPAPTPQ
jgi:nitronate monooxygenase